MRIGYVYILVSQDSLHQIVHDTEPERKGNKDIMRCV